MSKRKPEPIVIRLEPVKILLTPLGFQEWARQFLDAANSITVTEIFSPVRCFLVCRSIELALKAFLLAQGSDKHKLKTKLGHDLAKAIIRAESEGLAQVLDITDDEKDAITIANELYKSKRFEYFEILDCFRGFQGRPDMDKLSAIAEKLISGVKDTCMDA